MNKRQLKQEIMDYVAAAGHIALEMPGNLFTYTNTLTALNPEEITTCLFELVSEGKLVPEVRKDEFIHLRSAAVIREEKRTLKAAIKQFDRKDKRMIKRAADIINFIGNGQGEQTFDASNLSGLKKAMQDAGHSFTDKLFDECLIEIMKERRLLKLPFKKKHLTLMPVF